MASGGFSAASGLGRPGAGYPPFMRLLQAILHSRDATPAATVQRLATRTTAGAGRAPDRLLTALDSLGRAEPLDSLVTPARRAVRAFPLGPVRDVLRGLPLGHPLHPLLVQIPIGAWMSAAVLDLLPGEDRAARRLVAVGLATAGPAALAGWVDWADQRQEQLRTGVVHAASNVTAAALYAGSLAARMRGAPVWGRVLGFAGLAAVGAGGMLGGHLAYRQASGTNHAESVPYLVEPGWHLLGRMEDFPVGEPVRRVVGEVPVLVVREAGGQLHTLADRCSHMSGPLSRGTVADGCVTCPWHGSVFRLSDGRNVSGPATAPQPAFETRLHEDGTVEARLPAAG